MLYRDALHYMYEQLPMFQRVGSAAYKNNLNNTLAISEHLNAPENKFKSVHVAGTNGKGSSSHLLASILQSAGYKTGLYTSPHLKDFRERIRINGAMIPKKTVSLFIEKNKDFFSALKPSFFEMTVGLAFDWFAKEKIDIAIIETGLGGRLDSTNIITPEVCLITNISFDHVQLLGNTLTQIAGEKAGIIKSNVPVVISEMDLNYAEVFMNKAKEKKSSIVFASNNFLVEKFSQNLMFASYRIKENNQLLFSNIKCPLLGDYQKKNIGGVLAVCKELQKKSYQISKKNISDGIRKVIVQTGLLGRWQILNKAPIVIADTGHNEAGIKLVLEQLGQIPHQNFHFVLGLVNDKDASSILGLLPKEASYYFCEAKIPRALNKLELKNMAFDFGLIGDTFVSVKAALNSAKRKAQKNDLIFVGGSTFVVAEIV